MNKNDKFITFGEPLIGDEEINDVVSVLKSGWLGTGPKVKIFENNFKDYKSAAHAIAVSSATAALHLSLICSNLKPGDEVITTAMTFCSTVNAIIHSGATPVIVDIDFKTGNINPNDIDRAITNKTKAIIPVHYSGIPCDMDAIMKIAHRNDLIVIEDCAHAIESEYKGKKIGTFGDFGCFSFYVTKNLATGEGGMVITKSSEAAKRIKTLSLHGMNNDAWKRFSSDGYRHYKVEEAGYKYNMTDIQAAIGINQLVRLDKNWIKRKKIWEFYYDNLKKTNLMLPPRDDKNNKFAYHLFPILLNKKISISRDDLLIKLNNKGIGCGVHYESIPDHPFYQKEYGWKPENTPIAKLFGRSVLSLPITPVITNDDLDYIIKIITKYVS